LQRAAESHDFETLDMLLADGADINEADFNIDINDADIDEAFDLMTPLHYMIQHMDDNPQHIEEMLKRGARVGLNNDVKLLSLLMERNLKECFKLVVDRKGKDINGKDRDINFKGRTPVHRFLEAGDGDFHDRADAKWIVIRGPLRGHNDMPCGRPTPGLAALRAYLVLLSITNIIS
jgi:hypothetical protein